MGIIETYLKAKCKICKAEMAVIEKADDMGDPKKMTKRLIEIVNKHNKICKHESGLL